MTREHENCELERRAERSFKGACCQALAKFQMTHDLDVKVQRHNDMLRGCYREGRVQNHATKTQDTWVGAVENAEECAVR